MPDSLFEFFTHYHHLKVSKLDDSVVDLLGFKGKIQYQTIGEWWSSNKASVVKDDGALENYVGRKIIDELQCQGAALSAQDAGWMIVDMTNVNSEDRIEKCQQVTLKLRLGA